MNPEKSDGPLNEAKAIVKLADRIRRLERENELLRAEAEAAYRGIVGTYGTLDGWSEFEAARSARLALEGKG